MIKRLSDLITKSRSLILSHGNEKGICAFCGKKESTLLKLKLKPTFTAHEYLQNTKLICPGCQHLYETAEYRNNAWIVTPTSFRKLKRFDVLKAIIDNDELPWAIYTTDTYKKQGWLSLLCKINYSLQNFIVAWDFLLLSFSRGSLLYFIEKGRKFQELGLSKNEMLTGRIKPKNLKIPMLREILHDLEVFHHNLLWEWVIAFLPPLKENIQLIKKNEKK